MVNMIRKRLESAHGRWAEDLHGVLWAYRTTPKIATQETPFSLVYGMESVVPTEVHVKTTVSGPILQEENNELLTLNLDLLDEKREAARIRNTSYQQKIARTYNKKVRIRTFQQEDWVLRRLCDHMRDKSAGKLAPGWEGPYNVIEVQGAGAYKLQDSKGKVQPNCWNALHLKLYHF
ncbi:hypothetical protein Bca4012_020210 [Brassica carinata]